MENPVIVVDDDAFAVWVDKQKELAASLNTPESRGEALVAANGCVACHSINGAAGIGPTWLGLFGSEVPLSDGTTVVADEAFITESIKSPQAKIDARFVGQQMPTYGFTDEQIADLVAYIKTLK
jgi:cytochrome c oxidase subunit 2